MSITKTIKRGGETRTITINGNAGAKFELYVKETANYYNWETDSFQTLEKILKNQEIPFNGIYTKNIIIPKVTANKTYDFFSDLTGGTLTNTTTTLTQTGTITEASGLFVYTHSIPSWNRATGGDWTLSNTVDSVVQWSSGTSVKLTDSGGTNVASGDSVTGDHIIDEITVSAISGDLVTLSAPQNLHSDQELTFSKSAWEIGPLSAVVSETSGTTSVTMTTTHNIAKLGIADITCVLDVDSCFSVKPNAFPITDVECPAGGEVVIEPIADCTNYLGTRHDIDANVASKTYKVHSVPAADLTAARPYVDDDAEGGISYVTLDIAGTSSVSAGAAMGSAGAAEVTYTAHANHIAGDTDFFYYKTVDAQSTPVNSATDQGKISITIV